MFAMLRKLLVVGLVAVTSTAYAAEWVQVAENSNGSTFSVEPSTLVRNGNIRRVWVLTSYGSTKSNGTRSYKSLSEFDCRERRSRDLATVYYDGVAGSGNSKSTSGIEAWDYVVPGTAYETLANYVCAMR